MAPACKSHLVKSTRLGVGNRAGEALLACLEMLGRLVLMHRGHGGPSVGAWSGAWPLGCNSSDAREEKLPPCSGRFFCLFPGLHKGEAPPGLRRRAGANLKPHSRPAAGGCSSPKTTSRPACFSFRDRPGPLKAFLLEPPTPLLLRKRIFPAPGRPNPSRDPISDTGAPVSLSWREEGSQRSGKEQKTRAFLAHINTHRNIHN